MGKFLFTFSWNAKPSHPVNSGGQAAEMKCFQVRKINRKINR